MSYGELTSIRVWGTGFERVYHPTDFRPYDVGGGSAQRGNHSVFGLAFALYDSKRPVPTHILVYDSHNEIKLVDSLDRLCLVRRDLGSNYDLGYREVDALRQAVLLCDWESSRE